MSTIVRDTKEVRWRVAEQCPFESCVAPWQRAGPAGTRPAAAQLIAGAADGSVVAPSVFGVGRRRSRRFKRLEATGVSQAIAPPVRDSGRAVVRGLAPPSCDDREPQCRTGERQKLQVR